MSDKQIDYHDEQEPVDPEISSALDSIARLKSLGTDKQAEYILEQLIANHLEILQQFYRSSEYLLKSFAWYNGREEWIGITVNDLHNQRCFVFTFGENRNSDTPCLDRWVINELMVLNPPTLHDYSDEAYHARRHANSADEIVEMIASDLSTILMDPDTLLIRLPLVDHKSANYLKSRAERDKSGTEQKEQIDRGEPEQPKHANRWEDEIAKDPPDDLFLPA